jgi:sialidase-1
VVSPPVNVFVGGEGGYPVYRIPSLLRIHGPLVDGGRGGHMVSSDGAPKRLLAFAEARGSLADVGENDLVMRASDDGGRSWSAQRVVAEIAGRSLNNPTAVEVVLGTHAGRVLLIFQSYPEGGHESRVVEGYGISADAKDDLVCRSYIIHSDDCGETWSAPREITREVKRATGATSTASGPGIGVQLTRGPKVGRIVIPFNEGPPNKWKVYAAFSDDGGESWRIGATAPDGKANGAGGGSAGVANEVQMFERADGAVVLNARQHLGAHLRKSAVSRDAGESWSTLVDEPNLVEPECMGGVVTDDGERVFYTGADSPTRRARGTLCISRDGGRTWPGNGSPDRVLIEPGGFAYSVPVLLSEREVGVLYEAAAYARIVFRRVEVVAQP